MSPHFKPNNSLCPKPVDAARRTSVRSRMLRLSTRALISAGVNTVGVSASLRTLTDEMDRIAVKQLISACVIKEDGHQIANLGATTLRQRQTSKPRFDLYCSNFSQLLVSPVWTNPSVQIYLVGLFRRVAAPRVIFREFSLLKVIAELRDGNRVSTNPRLLRIDLCQQDRDNGTGRSFVWIAFNRANYFVPLDASSTQTLL